MSYNDFLDHTCDIYHMAQGENKGLGYRLTAEPSFEYPATADESGVACHFDSVSTTLNQNEPNDDLLIRTKLNLPVGTDLRLLDKVIWNDTGLEYTVISPPRTVHGHHVYAYVERQGVQKPI